MTIVNVQRGYYTLQFSHTGLVTIADSTSYHYGLRSAAPNTNGAVPRVYIPWSGTLIAGYWYGTMTAGSGESVTIAWRIDNTTDVQITASSVWNTAIVAESNTGLSQAVTAGSYMSLKMTTPAWATNPSNLTSSAVALIRY